MRTPTEGELDEVAATFVGRLSTIADRQQDHDVRRAFLMRTLARLTEEARPVYAELRAMEDGTWHRQWPTPKSVATTPPPS